MKLPLAQILRFELADGRGLLVPPITRDQARAAFSLDPGADAAPEPPAAADERRAAQLAILIRAGRVLAVVPGNPPAGDEERPASPVDAAFLGSLSALEEHDLLAAVVSHHHGFNPADAVALQHALRAIALMKSIPSPVQP
jgi:hypothetical protein